MGFQSNVSACNKSSEQKYSFFWNSTIDKKSARIMNTNYAKPLPKQNLHKILRKIQGDSKRWTQLNSKRRPNTRQTVGCGIPSSLLALRVDLRGLP